MGAVDQGDDLTFRVNFVGDGVAKLRDRVREKLKEFMGDYTDDTLVVYALFVALYIEKIDCLCFFVSNLKSAYLF